MTMDYNTMRDVVRYHIEFDAIPQLCHDRQEQFLLPLLTNAASTLSNLYNRLWRQYLGEKPFSKYDFSCRRIADDEHGMLYITLPRASAEADMSCRNLGITYRINNGGYADVRVYHVEFSALGTSAIGAMNVAGQGASGHANFGEASQSDEDNIRRIWELAFDQPLQQIVA